METSVSTEFIADTSGIVALTIQSDSNHHKAIAAVQRLTPLPISILIPSAVFHETMNLIGKRFSHAQAVQVARYLSSLPLFFLLDSTPTQREATLQRFETQPERVSYTDCVVMAVADEYQTKLIFGFDTDHEKNGYTILST